GRTSAAARGVDSLRLQGDRRARSLLFSVDLLPRAGRSVVRSGDHRARVHRGRGPVIARPRPEAATVGGTESRQHRADAAAGHILMRFFALTYDVVPDFGSRRQAFREAHLRLVRDAHDRSVLLLAGALGDPPDGALLVF